MAKIIHVNFKPNITEEEDPCSLCSVKDSCCTTCKKAEIYWTNLATLLKGKDV